MLYQEGYELEIRGGYLLVHHIPYLNAKKEVLYGALVLVLTHASPNRAGRPKDHTAFFTGETPYNADGTPLNAVINNSNRQQLTETITIQHYFSSKPKQGHYNDYYDQVRTYAEILSVQAKEVNPVVTPKPNQKKS